MTLILVPQYSQPSVSKDEADAKSIADLLDSDTRLPTHCGRCHAKGSFENPLMMEPVSRLDNGLPRGTLYRAKCARCKERTAKCR